MLHESIAQALNQQIALEGQSSHTYLTMAVWAETSGFDGVAEFLYAHSEEERQHMLKLMRFVNERGGVAEVPTVEAGPTSYEGLKEVFEEHFGPRNQGDGKHQPRGGRLLASQGLHHPQLHAVVRQRAN